MEASQALYLSGIGIGIGIGGTVLSTIATRRNDTGVALASLMLVVAGTWTANEGVKLRRNLQNGDMVLMACLPDSVPNTNSEDQYICLGKVAGDGKNMPVPYGSKLVAKAVRPQPVAQTADGKKVYLGS